jgi:hypothetical protein
MFPVLDRPFGTGQVGKLTDRDARESVTVLPFRPCRQGRLSNQSDTADDSEHYIHRKSVTLTPAAKNLHNCKAVAFMRKT